jgi:cell division protein FtsB
MKSARKYDGHSANGNGNHEMKSRHGAINQPNSFSGQFANFLQRNLSWLLGLALALLLLQDIFGTHGLVAMRRSQKNAAQIQQEIARIDEENQQLQDRVKALKSDPAAIERIAREEMGLARPGEYIFKIPPKRPNSDNSAQRKPH